MEDTSRGDGEQRVLPFALRRGRTGSDDAGEQEASDVAESGPVPRGEGKKCASFLSEGRDGEDGAVLQLLVRDKIESVQQLHLAQKQNLRLEAEVANAQRLRDNLQKQLLDRVEELHCLQAGTPPSISQPTAVHLQRRCNHLTAQADSQTAQLSEQQSLQHADRREIADLTQIALSRDLQLTSLQREHATLQRAFEDTTAAHRVAREQIARLERDNATLQEEHRATLKSAELLTCDLAFLRDKSRNQCRPRSAAGAVERSLRHELTDARAQYEAINQQNRLLQQRNQDLVDAYWPIMRKLKSHDHTVHTSIEEATKSE